MFDWDDQHQVGESIWAEFPENEDHIVPFPKGAKESTLSILGNYGRKQRNEEASIGLRSNEQSSGSKNNFLESNQDDSSTFITNEELSAAQLDADSWPDLPSLSTALDREYIDPHNRGSLGTHLMLDISEATNLDKMRVQLDGPSEMFGNDKDEKDNENYLDCDWAHIGDIEDLDKIFSGNDSIFGHEMVGNLAEFLSASSDVVNSTIQSIPLPDMQLSKDQHFGLDPSSLHLDELSSGKEIPEDKTADSTLRTGSEYCEAQNLSSDKSNSRKRPLMSDKKAEEKVKTKDFQNISATWSCNTNESQQLQSSTMSTCSKTPTKTFQSIVQRQVTAPADNGQLDSPNLFMFCGDGYAAYPFQHVYTKRNEEKPLSIGHKPLMYFPKSLNALDSPSDMASKQLKMTPQEKIEKLRRRQQMQAMLAIQQQQQQFAQPNTVIDSLVPQVCSSRKQTQESMTTSSAVNGSANKLISPEQIILFDQEESWRVSTINEDHTLEETIYYQLQDALGQLDIRIRLCIRDSLFRLAQSAMERQSASETSSSNKNSRDEEELPAYETKRLCRSSVFLDAETHTNPIDRTVAHLLFHKPSELFTIPVKEELPQSPVAYGPVPKALNESVEWRQMDVQSHSNISGCAFWSSPV
ncbi:hypothetical protein OPV22_008773 [Ensete ventricosum]|uniref:Protein LNK2 n=1 Tax=Ensete ventricosum TaxID=4639 RepID=A0AAV8RGX8_ENSVE|nr:hypothetical protein OPV22_008773 [Ensete ventricosum]